MEMKAYSQKIFVVPFFYIVLIMVFSTDLVYAADGFKKSKEAELNYIFKSGDDGYATFRIPALITAKSGRLLAFAEGRVKGSSDNGNIDLVMKTSYDNGKTWSPIKVIWDDGENACQNPAPVVDMSTGNITILMTRKLGSDREQEIIKQTSTEAIRVYISNSTNVGENWSEPKEITENVSQENWTWYATGPGHGIQLKNGEQKGRLIIACDHIEAGTEKYFSHIIYSDDGGFNWQIGGTTPQDQVNECTVAELSSGQLLLNMRNYNPAHRARMTSLSIDGGMTWTDLKPDTALIEPICQASLLFSPENKKLYFLNPAHKRSRENMTLKSSADEGKTWQTVQVLYRGPAAYSDLAFMGKNQFGCLFEAGKENPYEGIVFNSIEIH